MLTDQKHMNSKQKQLSINSTDTVQFAAVPQSLRIVSRPLIQYNII